MTALIIFIICLTLGISACVWCSWDQKRIMNRFNKPTRKKEKQAKVIYMRMSETKKAIIDTKLSMDYQKVMKK